jgi:hypothetical protein
MNNSKIIKDNILEAPENIDNSAAYRKQEQELLEVIEALENIKASNYWKLLEKKVWIPSLETLQRQLNKEKEVNQIFQLQGQIKWVEKIADLETMLLITRNKLTGIRNNLK